VALEFVRNRPITERTFSQEEMKMAEFDGNCDKEKYLVSIPLGPLGLLTVGLALRRFESGITFCLIGMDYGPNKPTSWPKQMETDKI
jgi:hypothetical protein